MNFFLPARTSGLTARSCCSYQLPPRFLLRSRVSVNDMKLSAQNLSRRAFFFVLCELVYEARFGEARFEEEKTDALLTTNAPRSRTICLALPLRISGVRLMRTIYSLRAAMRADRRNRSHQRRDHGPHWSHGGGRSGQGYGCGHGLHTNRADQRTRTVFCLPASAGTIHARSHESRV